MKKTMYILQLSIILLFCFPGSASYLTAGEIHDAAAAGDLNKVKLLLKADSCLLESRDDRMEFKGNTPLISACWASSFEWGPEHSAVASFLIDKGADVNAGNNNGATPLYFAVKDYHLTERLISMGALVQIKAYGDYTPLFQAAFSGNTQVIKLLMEYGADPNFNGTEGTVIHFLIRMKRVREELIKVLIEGGANLNQKFSFGNTELHLAVFTGSADIIAILVKYGADVNSVNDFGHTPLYYAAKHGYKRTANALFAVGAKENTISEANFGKAPQLTNSLQNGEAYLWYLGGNVTPSTGYAVKTKDHLVIFDPPEIDTSTEAGLVNGKLNPDELNGQKITFLFTRPNGLPGTTVFPRSAYGPGICQLKKQINNPGFVVCFNPAEDRSDFNNTGELPPYLQAVPNEVVIMNDIRIHSIPALLQSFIERGPNLGLGYLVEVDGMKIFHAGLHAVANDDSFQITKYRKSIDDLKPYGPVDFAILPITGSHLTVNYDAYRYMIDQLSPRAIYLIGDFKATSEHEKCVEILKTADIQIFYPEGGIAVGERFHYTRNN